MAASSRSSSAVQPPRADVSPVSVTREHPPATSGVKVMLAAACALLVAWLLAIVFGGGQLAHFLLLVGLMLLMMAALKSRDAAMRRPSAKESQGR